MGLWFSMGQTHWLVSSNFSILVCLSLHAIIFLISAFYLYMDLRVIFIEDRDGTGEAIKGMNEDVSARRAGEAHGVAKLKFPTCIASESCNIAFATHFGFRFIINGQQAYSVVALNMILYVRPFLCTSISRCWYSGRHRC